LKIYGRLSGLKACHELWLLFKHTSALDVIDALAISKHQSKALMVKSQTKLHCQQTKGMY
jgi:hypothetical protein